MVERAINNQAPEVTAVFDQFPTNLKQKLIALRELIVSTAAETDGVTRLEETLKWGEPGYLTKTGSTIRIGCVKSQPGHYAAYFNCKTNLIDTFRELYPDTFTFAGNRAIVLAADEPLPEAELKHCFSLALTYHQRKKLPLLGA